MSKLAPETVVAFIGEIFNRRGAESYLGEQVTMSEHMLQGAQLAEQAGAPDALIAGATLNNVGLVLPESTKLTCCVDSLAGPDEAVAQPSKF